MKWLKAMVVGALGGLVMSIIMVLYIKTGLAPFNQAPSGAFLDKFGLKMGPLPVLMHFGYGTFWSVVLVALFKERTNMAKGIGLALVVLLIYLVIYSPLIGWGFFGIGGSGHQLPPDHPLYLGNPLNHLMISTFMHLIYGAIIGWLNPLWSNFGKSKGNPKGSKAESETR